MSIRNPKAYPRKFSKSLADSNLRGFIGGQPLIFKVLTLLCTFTLIVLAGYLGGVLSGYVLIPLLFSAEKEEQVYSAIYLVVCMVLTVCVWSFEIERKTISRGLLQAGLIIIIASLSAQFFIPSKPDDNHFVPVLIFTSFFLCTYIVAFLAASFSVSLLLVLMKQNRYKSCKMFYIFIIIFSSILTSYFAGLISPVTTQPDKYPYVPPYVDSINLLAGFLIGLLTVKLSLDVSDVAGKPRRNFEFLRISAINFSTLGSTSFYQLDISGLDFTGANLANTDFRASKFYRTCLKDVEGLDRARVNNHYFDINKPEVQMLLIRGFCHQKDFLGINLQGAYLRGASDMREFNLTDAKLNGADLQEADLRGSNLLRTQLTEANLQRADLRRINFTDANLTAADCRGADLRDCILVRAQAARADFRSADLTGICIEDWSISSKTRFTDVRCDYIYRRYQDGQLADRYPVDRNFEPSEFAALFQQPENELELVFKGEFDYTALSLTFDKLKTDKPDLNLKLQGIEQREKLWVVKVTSTDPTSVETRIKEIQDAVYQRYELSTTRLENNPLIRRIISDVANIKKTQKETVEEVKQLRKPPTVKKILILAANPRGDLKLDQEIRDIEEGLSRSLYREQFDLKIRLAVRAKDLQAVLLEVKPWIVHFCGHGSGSQGLVLENDVEKQQLVSTEAIADLFRIVAKWKIVECVLLNACYSQSQADEIVKHINYVIGMRQEIRDDAAIAFTVAFYEALGSGETIESAYEFGCNRIQLEINRSTASRKGTVVGVTEPVKVPEHLIPVLLKNPNPVVISSPVEEKIESSPPGNTNMNRNRDGIQQIISGVQKVDGGMIAVQDKNNQPIMQIDSTASHEKQLTQQEVIQLLMQIEQLVQSASELPSVTKDKSLRYLSAVKDEAQATKPDKEFAASNLKRMAESLKNAAETVISTKSLWENVKPILMQLSSWLGVTVI